MIVWLDAQLSPDLAPWMAATFGVDAQPVRALRLHEAKDTTIYLVARQAGAVIMSKDRDFVDLLQRLGPPPRVIWITCGNTSNARLTIVLRQAPPSVTRLLEQGAAVVEISDQR